MSITERAQLKRSNTTMSGDGEIASAINRARCLHLGK